MRLVQRFRRLGPAFLAALVLVASLASAGHAHAAVARTLTVQSAAEDVRTAVDLECALCASAQRLGHGVRSLHIAAPLLTHRHLHPRGTDSGGLARVGLDLSEARSPPRHG